MMNREKNLNGVEIKTTQGTYVIQNFHSIEGYGSLSKDRLDKIVSNIKNLKGVLKCKINGDEVKIDLTQQVCEPKFY